MATADGATAGSAAFASAAGTAPSVLWAAPWAFGGVFRPNSMNVDPQVSQVIAKVG